MHSSLLETPPQPQTITRLEPPSQSVARPDDMKTESQASWNCAERVRAKRAPDDASKMERRNNLSEAELAAQQELRERERVGEGPAFRGARHQGHAETKSGRGGRCALRRMHLDLPRTPQTRWVKKVSDSLHLPEHDFRFLFKKVQKVRRLRVRYSTVLYS